MKLLADYHHADLFESHQLTFGDRFGWEVYAPYGMAWFDRWFWSFERAAFGDRVARQYLLGIWGEAQPDANGIVTIADPRHPGRTLRGITLEAALDRRFDLVLSSVPENAHGFHAFARLTRARFATHIGNQWGEEAWEERPDFAIVTTTSAVPGDVRHVVIHQEFSRTDFRYEPPAAFGPVRSFVNCFPDTSEYQDFLRTARGATDLDFEVYGALGSGTPDEFTRGELGQTPAVAAAMRGAGAIWHAKHWSDGFGHVIHNAFAVGRPVVGYARYYADKLAGPLWVDGVTSIDIERHDAPAELRALRADPDRYRAMCAAAAARFDAVVDFDADAEALRGLLDDVLSAVAA